MAQSAVKRLRPLLNLRFVVAASLMTLGPMLLLATAVVVWMALRDSNAKQAVESEIASMETAGLPYDNVSLARSYEQSSDDEDVSEWLALLSSLKSTEFLEAVRELDWWSGSGARVPAATEAWPEEAETRQFLNSWSDMIVRSQRLALLDKKVRFPIRFRSLATELTWTQRVRELARLFQLRAQVAGRDRDSVATADATLAIYGCARAIEGQPFLISHSVSVSIEDIAARELKRALESDLLTTSDMERMRDRIEGRAKLGELWPATMAGERASTIPIFKEQGWTMPLRSRDLLLYLDIMDQAIHVPVDNLNEFYRATRAVHSRMVERFADERRLARWDAILTASIMPPISAAADSFIHREMLSRLALLGIAVRLYEDSKGELPQRFEDMSRAGFDIDELRPLGDRPFGFRSRQDQVILWGFPNELCEATPDEPLFDSGVSEWDIGTGASSSQLSERTWLWSLPVGHVARSRE